jgi:hypothetical protein
MASVCNVKEIGYKGILIIEPKTINAHPNRASPANFVMDTAWV